MSKKKKSLYSPLSDTGECEHRVINDCTHKEFVKSIKKLFGSVTLLIMR